MVRPALLVLGLLVTAGLGCSEDETSLDASRGPDVGVRAEAGVTEDAAAPDAEPADADPSDASPPDAAPADADAPDAAPADAGEMDAGAAPADAEPADAENPDAATPDAGACNYIDLSVCIVECTGRYEYARQFVDTNMNAACPEFFRLLGNDYPTIQAAVSGAGCSSTCIYKAANSVSFIDHCGRRNGFIIYSARGTSCPDLFEFSNGLFLSILDWEANTPCP